MLGARKPPPEPDHQGVFPGGRVGFHVPVVVYKEDIDGQQADRNRREHSLGGQPSCLDKIGCANRDQTEEDKDEASPSPW